MYAFLTVIQVFICIALIGLILVQQGKGATMGAAFGAGASQTVFGSQGAGNFLTRTTAILATAFFLNCLVLSYLVISQRRAQAVQAIPQAAVQQPATQPKQTQPTQPTQPAKPAGEGVPLIN